MDSNLNKGHKTSPNAQPSGFPSPGSGGKGGGPKSPDQHVLGLHAKLCELVDDATERAELLGVPPTVDAAWTNGRMLPVLHARRKLLERLVFDLERKALSQASK